MRPDGRGGPNFRYEQSEKQKFAAKVQKKSGIAYALTFFIAFL